MKIEIFITGNKHLHIKGGFVQSFMNLLNNDSNTKTFINQQPKEAEILLQKGLNTGMEELIPNILTLDEEFALRLNLLDSINCSCLQEKTQLGKLVKEIMIDKYQLILTRKHWIETNHLMLYFEAVDYGNVYDFLDKTLSNTK